ncbi:related to protein phosphatase 2c [Cephalotrichum gorgonifer]|uniref:Related to protein phosphatase 2c n=1 Tax=Cephalotrichum gorgonifer TaxID=2041049 RepID=A0AAE8N500_9PEZI|nr:related to protein phosphatase 2c [Cephalotrichum gorgonifer]
MTSRPWSTLSRRARLRSRAVAPRRALRPALTARSEFSTALPRAAPGHLDFADRRDAADVETGAYPLQTSNHSPRASQAPTRQTTTTQTNKPSSRPTTLPAPIRTPRRGFHNYFVTHLPSSSMHPDRRRFSGPGHGLPRDASVPHTPQNGHSPATIAGPGLAGRDLTVVRIPLRSAKHHFGSATARGTRPYNEDTDQAGTIDMPAFAKRAPMSLVRSRSPGGPRAGQQADVTSADSSFGDPQIFYFGVFDGHGGSECSRFLKEELHGYIELASAELGLLSSLGKKHRPGVLQHRDDTQDTRDPETEADLERPAGVEAESAQPEAGTPVTHQPAIAGSDPLPARVRNFPSAVHKFTGLVDEYKDTITVESVLEYAFLRADLDFVTAQASKPDPLATDAPLNSDEILGLPHVTPSGHRIGGRSRFRGGSTASIALVSTPTPAPFWHPSAHATLMVAHVGDTRIILCDTATGLAVPVTSDHHPTSPAEAARLRRYAPAASLVTDDSFGEQRIAGLANSRAFGDVASKRIGVSAEPEITRVEMAPAQYAFLILCSDGISGTLSDQEMVDIVKEAATPDEAATAVVNFSTEVSTGDNATCQVVRLGGWERRSEGGLGSLGTKEVRDLRRAEAVDPRRGKR